MVRDRRSRTDDRGAIIRGRVFPRCQRTCRHSRCVCHARCFSLRGVGCGLRDRLCDRRGRFHRIARFLAGDAHLRSASRRSGRHGRRGRRRQRAQRGNRRCTRTLRTGAGRTGLRASGSRRPTSAGCWRRLEREHAQQRHREASVFVGREAQLASADRCDLIEQLHLLGAQCVGEAAQVGRLRPFVEHRRRRELRPRDPMQQARQILQRRRKRQTAQGHFIGDREHRRAVALRERVEQADQIALVERAEHAAHRVFADLVRRIGYRLISQR
ncbi:hypothetical protein QF002_005304 [Paraburkholderia youngii]